MTVDAHAVAGSDQEAAAVMGAVMAGEPAVLGEG
jgi:hypothetical protein